MLDFHGIGIHTASGKVGRLDGALWALMGEMYLENLALHVRRGLEGVVRDGHHAGGRAYGYAVIIGKPGELTIDEAQAVIVRRIFAEFHRRPHAARDRSFAQYRQHRVAAWRQMECVDHQQQQRARPWHAAR